jgi:hypothetical protein
MKAILLPEHFFMYRNQRVCSLQVGVARNRRCAEQLFLRHGFVGLATSIRNVNEPLHGVCITEHSGRYPEHTIMFFGKPDIELIAHESTHASLQTAAFYHGRQIWRMLGSAASGNVKSERLRFRATQKRFWTEEGVAEMNGHMVARVQKQALKAWKESQK